MQSEGVSLPLSFTLTAHTLLLSLSLSSLSALHSPFAYQLTARILISFQHCSSSAASLYQSPNPSPAPLQVTQTTLLKTKFHFYFKCQQQQLKAKVYVK